MSTLIQLKLVRADDARVLIPMSGVARLRRKRHKIFHGHGDVVTWIRCMGWLQLWLSSTIWLDGKILSTSA